MIKTPHLVQILSSVNYNHKPQTGSHLHPLKERGPAQVHQPRRAAQEARRQDRGVQQQGVLRLPAQV